jgi:hypothetical protein
MESENLRDKIDFVHKLARTARRYPAPPALSGFLIAIISCVGCFLTYLFQSLNFESIIILMLLWIFILIASGLSIFILLRHKIKKLEQPSWTYVSLELILHIIPFVIIGILSSILIPHSYIHLLPAIILVLIGLIYYTAGHFTSFVVRLLGILLLLGSIGCFYSSDIYYSIYITGICFGSSHLFYGFLILWRPFSGY